ncbi:MAG TPA: glutathione S-transferase family protein [Citreicella sp.]|nr:glutathione S-transferase family protein [Citreicella sp.]
MTELVLYGHPDSGHANKVALALALAGVPHELRRVDIWAPAATRPAEFLAASPLAQVPLLMVDGVPHLQSGAILMEVARRWPLPGQQPHDLRRGAELILWEANRIGMCLPQLVESRRPGGDSFPPGALDWLRARYATDRDNFDRLLGAGPFFHGAAPGIGDCAIWGYVRWIDRAGVAPSPAMADWRTRMACLPAMPRDFFPA